jgi:hypothetical protein
MNKLSRHQLFGAPIIALLLGTAVPVTLASIQIPLDTGNSGLAGYLPNFGYVNVTYLTSTTATIELTNVGTGASSPHVYFYGGAQSFDLNVNGLVDVNATLATITGTQPFQGSFTPGNFSSEGTGKADGLGTYNFRLRTFDGYQHSSSYLKFTLVGSGTSWTSDEDVLVANPSGFLAAAHVFVSADGTKSGGAAVTGYAAGGDPTAASPEPVSLVAWSLLIASASVVTMRRRQEGA